MSTNSTIFGLVSVDVTASEASNITQFTLDAATAAPS